MYFIYYVFSICLGVDKVKSLLSSKNSFINSRCSAHVFYLLTMGVLISVFNCFKRGITVLESMSQFGNQCHILGTNVRIDDFASYDRLDDT